jgi:hypothetical protein
MGVYGRVVIVIVWEWSWGFSFFVSIIIIEIFYFCGRIVVIIDILFYLGFGMRD